MEENFSWKVVYLAVFFSLATLLVAYLLIAPRESPFFTDQKTDKIAEFQQTRVTGRKEGKKVWELSAASGYTTKNHEITYLSDIVQGTIYKKGKPSIKNLVCKQARAFLRTNVIELSNLRAKMDIDQQWASVIADSLKYFPDEKRSEITGQVKIRKEKETLSADSARYFSEEEKIEADGNLSLLINEGKTATRLRANHGFSFSAPDKEMVFSGSLEVTQGKKVAVAEEGLYSRKAKELKIKRNAKVVFEKAKVLIDDKTAQKLKNPEAKSILKERTVLTADEITFFTRSDNAGAQGNVFVSQKQREAKSDQAAYDDDQSLLTLTGNVYMKKAGEWVRAQKVLVYVKQEAFEAVGSVEAEFKL